MSGKKGLIVKGIAGFYYVKSGDEVYRCKARGVFKQRAVKPAVGDEVEFEVIPENDDSLITGVDALNARYNENRRAAAQEQFYPPFYCQCRLFCDRYGSSIACTDFVSHR